MFKKIILSTIILTTLCGVGSSLNTTNNQRNKINNDNIIVNNKKVSLRQKADIKRATTIDNANIEISNVDYDLRYIYGGEKGYKTFDIWSLLPKENEDKDLSFKFLCAKPVGKNLYLYVYDVNNQNSEINSANFVISKSRTMNTTTGEFQENFISYKTRFINSYGYKKRFMKFSIDDIINLDDDVRFMISNGYISYSNGSKSLNNINHEFAFKVGGNDDFIGEYFKDDYIKITNGYVPLQLVGNTPIVGVNNDRKDKFYKYDENFYYMFNTDKKIDELIEIQYDYDLVNYNVSWHTGSMYSGVDWITKVPCYNGGLDFDYRGYEHSEPIIEHKVNNKITSGTTIVQVERPIFMWWNQIKTYTQENIIDLSDNGLDKISDEPTRDWFKTKRTKEKETYSWAFKITSNTRETIKYGSNGDWWSDLWGFSDLNSVSQCHEVKQALITWLKFRTNNHEFEFNALDIPKDTSDISVLYIPYETLGDMLIDNVIDWWIWFKSISNNVFKNIVPFLILLALVLVVILCLPILSSTTKLVGRTIGVANDRIKTKQEKKRKKK